MSGFVQVIEYRTSRQDEIDAFMQDWRVRHPEMGPRRVTVCQDRTTSGSYVSIIEFASYVEAMRNNEDPATREFSRFMMSVCDGPPVFHDLDVLQTEIRTEPAGLRARV